MSEYRWGGFAKQALRNHGYNEVVDKAGVNDYQGWGMYLGYNGTDFAVVSWFYGSCSGCDTYENMSHEEAQKEFDSMVQCNLSETDARDLFNKQKDW